jgi:hypothetical protein
MVLHDVGKDLASAGIQVSDPDRVMLRVSAGGGYVVGFVKLVLDFSVGGFHCFVERVDIRDGHFEFVLVGRERICCEGCE